MKKISLLIVVLLLAGCADSVSFEVVNNIEKVGFWHGVWHGLILPISWCLSLFIEEVAVYAIYNNGSWYDTGFFIGLGGLSGIGFWHSSSD